MHIDDQILIPAGAMTLTYTPAPIPDNEVSRLASLHALEVLDTPPEAEFDALVKVASMVCGKPVSLISLVDAERQWFKADVGLGAVETPRDIAFCAHAILDDHIFEVQDTLNDTRFAGNPLVLAAPNIRFYAGTPITLSNGARVGTLCVIDRVPGALTEMQREVLRNLGIAAAQALEARRALIKEQRQWVLESRAMQEARALTSTINIHAIVTEVDHNGLITACNQAFLDISGFSLEELIGRSHNIVNSGTHDAAFWEAMWSTISSGMPWRGEICNRSKSGKLYWVDSMIAPFVGEDGLVEKYVSIRTEITDRILAQQQQEALRQRFSLATESAGIGVWEWALATNTLVWDEQMYRIYQKEQTAATEAFSVWRDHMRPDDIAEFLAGLASAASGEKPFDTIFRILWPNGEVRYIQAFARGVRHEDGTMQKLVGVNYDVTEVHRARETLLSNKLLLDESQAVAKVGGWELNLQTGVLFWTDETYRIHEASPQTFNPTVDAGVSYFLPESREQISLAMEAAISRGKGYDLELKTYTTKGTLIDVRTTCTVTMQDGKAAKLTGIFQDITERKRYEHSLQEARDNAELATRTKGQFLANMSHEIRTPMNAILGMLKLLQKTALNSHQQDYASRTEGAARSLLGLLNDILDFSKVEAGKMTLDPHPFRIERVLRDLSVIFAANVGQKDVEVLFDIDPALPTELVGDDMRLQQVLLNLGGNAIKFTSSGEVILRVRLAAQTRTQVTVEFAVKDSGIGIAPENQGHIFTGFSQAESSTTRKFGGTGLGLAISSRLADLMGSGLKLQSALGEGSTFYFEAVFDQATAAKLTQPGNDTGAGDPRTLHAAPPLVAGLSKLRTLVVDDNPIALGLLVQMVEALGWQTDAASSGQQAIALVQESIARGQQYQAIFMDWQMPDLDGWQTSQRIRELTAAPGSTEPPVIMMVTAHGRDLLSQSTVHEQTLLNGYLVKPVTASMLLDVIADAQAASATAAAGHNPRAPQAVLSPQRLLGLRLLVVEDNEINQMVAEGLLSAEGADITLADDGQLGVDAVTNTRIPFDVVLMDLQMPVMDGYTATRIIRQELGLVDLPIIAMTANAMASDRAACLEAGMNDHVGKPFALDDLVEMLLRYSGRTPVQ